MIRLNSLQADQLEKLIDTSSLAGVMDALADICREKAEHIRSNWQDQSTAKVWDRAALSLDNTTEFANRLGI